MFIEVTQDFGVNVPKRKVILNTDIVAMLYEDARSGCIVITKDDNKLRITDTYDALVRRIAMIQSTAK